MEELHINLKYNSSKLKGVPISIKFDMTLERMRSLYCLGTLHSKDSLFKGWEAVVGIIRHRWISIGSQYSFCQGKWTTTMNKRIRQILDNSMEMKKFKITPRTTNKSTKILHLKIYHKVLQTIIFQGPKGLVTFQIQYNPHFNHKIIKPVTKHQSLILMHKINSIK